MIQEVQDTRLQFYLKRYIREHCTTAENYTLRNLLSCGTKIAQAPGHKAGVFLLANQEQAKFWGVLSCKNAWACPVCSARKMAGYASEIACLIEALKEKNQWAFMVTLSVPHTSTMSCEETLEILYNTWKKFNSRGNKTMLHAKINGWKDKDPFSNFCETFNCTHRVRVGEFTWGKHGWHPHFHCLFFVDADKFNKVLDWEEVLLKRWRELSKRETLRYWNKIYPDRKEKNKHRVEIMYKWLSCDMKNATGKESRGLFISKNANGIIKQETSMYICGWGADKELTGNYKNKASHADGHYTPYQLLEIGANQNNEKFMRLYIEYCLTIYKRKHMRINFSKPCRTLIKTWKQTNKFTEFIKKKFESDKKKLEWKILCWFTKEEWFKICELDRKFPIKHNILALSTLQNKNFLERQQLVAEYLEFYNIFVLEKEVHRLSSLVLEMFNSSLKVA